MPQITLAGSALSRPSTDAQLGSMSLELAAFDGEVGNSTVAVPDPTGLDEVVPGLSVLVSEGTTVLLDGRIVSEGRERGSSPAAGQKVDTYTVEDPNTFMFGFRVVADRPEETDYARIQWFFDAYLPAADTTFVLNTSTSTMVAASYASDGVSDIMRDAIDLTGKTLFIHDKAAGGLCAHWHALTGGHTCGLTISDAVGDPDQVTTWYPQNPARVRDGADLANDIQAYGADETIGPINVSDATSIATYDADGKLHQTFANFPGATDLATLALDAARLLETNKDPRDSFTCTIGPLDDTALALIRAGDIITVTSEILGLSESPQRISRLRLTVSAGTTAAPGLWDATLTMGAPVRGPGGRFGRSVARPPAPKLPFVCDPGTGAAIAGTWIDPTTADIPPFAADFPAFVGNSGGGSSSQLIFNTLLADSPQGMTYQIGASEDTWELHATMQFAPHPDDTGLALFYVAVAGAAQYNALKFIPMDVDFGAGVHGRQEVSPGYWSVFPLTGLVYLKLRRVPVLNTGGYKSQIKLWPAVSPGFEPEWADYALDIGAAKEFSFFLSPDSGSWTSIDVSITGVRVSTCDGAPVIGQAVPMTVVGISDGSTTDYTTAYPYAPGSLRVEVDRLNWTNEIIETNPATGEWEFTTAPASGDTIMVSYVGGI